MRLILAALAALAALVLTPLPAWADTVVVRAGHLIEPATGQVLHDQAITVTDGRVSAIAPWSAPPQGAKVVDWSSYWVLPGLIDVHVHLAEVDRRDGWSADILRKNDETTDAQRQGFTKAVKAGVKLPFGTDAGVFPHGLQARQFRYMVKYGMTPMQAIQSATTVAAEFLMWDKQVGSLTPGHWGDMIAVKANPLEDIGALERVEHVMQGGVVVR